MPASSPTVKGSSTVSFGIKDAVGTMIATNISANHSSNKVEAKNTFGGTAAVAYVGKKVEYSLEGYINASTNAATQGATFTVTNFSGFASISGGAYVEEVTLTKSAEDFAKIKYKVVTRDGIT